MTQKSGYSMFLSVFLILLGFNVPMVFSKDSLFSSNNRISPKPRDEERVIWQKPFRENGVTIIPGSAPTNFGRLELRWIIGAGGKARLVTLEPTGAGDMPPLEKKIFLFVRDNQTTGLYQEWFPLVNEKKPATIREITRVNTNELLSVLPDGRFPPASSISKTICSIRWGEKYQKNRVQYLPGKLTTAFGWRNIYWKKKSGSIPELFSAKIQASSDQRWAESRLYLLIDPTEETTVIFQEKPAKSNQGTPPYLWPLAVVRTSQLISGFKEIQ